MNVKILGEERFINYFERQDTDLSLVAATNRGSRMSPNIPFSSDALQSRYIERYLLEK